MDGFGDFFYLFHDKQYARLFGLARLLPVWSRILNLRRTRFLEHRDDFLTSEARLLLISGRGERNKVCGGPIATQTL